MSKVQSKEELRNRKLSLIPQLRSNLNEYFRKKCEYPVTESQKYDNVLYFTKGLGFKVYRNDYGDHILKINEEMLEIDWQRARED